MNRPRFPRLVTIGLTLAVLVALLAFFARAAFAQEVSADSTLRLTLGDHSVVVKGRVAHCRISDVDQNGVV